MPYRWLVQQLKNRTHWEILEKTPRFCARLPTNDYSSTYSDLLRALLWKQLAWLWIAREVLVQIYWIDEVSTWHCYTTGGSAKETSEKLTLHSAPTGFFMSVSSAWLYSTTQNAAKIYLFFSLQYRPCTHRCGIVYCKVSCKVFGILRFGGYIRRGYIRDLFCTYVSICPETSLVSFAEGSIVVATLATFWTIKNRGLQSNLHKWNPQNPEKKFQISKCSNYGKSVFYALFYLKMS